MGKPWKDEELIQLLKEVKMKIPTQEIAKTHKRTNGGIVSRLRSLAADYYCNDDMPVEQIMVITGLDKDHVIDAIEKREYQNMIKEKKAQMKPAKAPVAQEAPKSEITDLKEILGLLKSIDKKVSEYIKEKSIFGE
jgi:hypothetical protein